VTELERAARRLIDTFPPAITAPSMREHLGPGWQATALAVDELNDALADISRERDRATFIASRYCEHDDATTDAGFSLGD